MFKRLELENFEGYKNAEIDFAEGLNVITGRNSTGKTTILEALLFALYGGALGVDKRLMVSRLQGAGERMSVRLTAEIAGKNVEILRQGRLVGRGFRTERVGLKIDGKEQPLHGEDDLNKKVIELMGMGAKTFVALAYAKQGELTNILEPKKEEMDLILNITLMKELVEQLDSARKTLEKYEGKDAKTTLEMLRNQLPQLAQQISQLTEQEKTFSSEVEKLKEIVEKAKSEDVRQLLQQTSRRDSLLLSILEKRAAISNALKERGALSLKELKGQLKEAAKREEELREKLKKAQGEEREISGAWQQLNMKLQRIKATLEGVGALTVEEVQGKGEAVKAEVERLNAKWVTVEAELSKAEDLRSRLSGKLATLRDEIKSHRDLLSKGLADCPTCGQEINPIVLEQIIDDKEGLVEELSRKFNEVNAKHASLKENAERLKAKAMQLTANLTNLQQARDRLMSLLEGATVEQLEQRLNEAEKSLEGIRQAINGLTAELSKAEGARQSLQSAVENIARLEEEMVNIEGSLQTCLQEIGRLLNALAFPFSPDDPELRAKVAERLPLSPEELAKKEGELKTKSSQLEGIRKMLGELRAREEETNRRVGELEKRLEKAKTCEDLLEKIKGGIESQRELRLRRVAEVAMRAYDSLTDQRVYKAFRINKEDYTVEVFPHRLENYIPAKRTGGGHQTLIALAVRIALLNVLGRRSLMILDEPTYGVDSENLPQLMSYFSEAAKKIGQTILVTHYGLGEEEAANIIRVSIAPDGSSRASTFK